MKYYPLTENDLEQIGYRIADEQSAIIPIRHDVTGISGQVYENLLGWGHPNAYTIVKHGKKFYGVSKMDENREFSK